MFTPTAAKGCTIRTSTASNYLKSKLLKSEPAPEHQHTMHKFRECTNNSRPYIRTHGWDFTYTKKPSILPKQLNKKLKTRLGTRFHNRIRKLPARTTHSGKTSSFAFSFQLTTASQMAKRWNLVANQNNAASHGEIWKSNALKADCLTLVKSKVQRYALSRANAQQIPLTQTDLSLALNRYDAVATYLNDIVLSSIQNTRADLKIRS
ncbi:hypothetical protein F511_31989 [Dorcoceras hygrometricum]|uniref:Uncharacterized protein n=1 Tax=Dorcoceras hygrometricum TaxID=472368 RepID=A0A2Z7CQA2_9LAMI|nr:hypothetical protein F511_31989 [Dorcoceras hygrometricum]